MTPAPLQRLQVNDGMLITADHWQIAHSYHRQRQAIHYEALHTGGIVSGLGVSVGPIPATASSKYRSPRWLTIQPGLAIDDYGNPIVVAQAESCYLSAQPTKATTIYVVLRHSERATQAGVEIVQEAFQILEKDSPASKGEVELCRISLQPLVDGIESPKDVFSPQSNQLDLRYRLPAQKRPRTYTTISSWSHNNHTKAQAKATFRTLLASGQSLYPQLSGEWISRPQQSDLSHLSHKDFCQLDHAQQQQLTRYLAQGSVVIVEATATNLCELYQVEEELRKTLANQDITPKHITPDPLEPNASPEKKSKLQISLETELKDVQKCIATTVEDLALPLKLFLEEQQLPIPSDHRLSAAHPVKSYPFLFGQLPTLHTQPIGLYAWGGLLLLIGPLTQAWQISDRNHLSREEIRSAQEFGINLLSFASRRRQMQQAINMAHPSGHSAGHASGHVSGHSSGHSSEVNQ